MDSYQEFKNILVDRQGDDHNSHMKTIKIIGTIEPNKSYRIFPQTLLETSIKISQNNIGNDLTDNPPLNAQIDNILSRWQKEIINDNDNSNILGKNGTLTLDTDKFVIPEIEATDKNLSFYNAKLLKVNDTIQFNNNKRMPVTIMNIGENYVKSFLLHEEKGGGCYLEYHDTPHFHMPLNDHAGGYLILGRNLDFKCYLSAFKIPYGYAVYTAPYTIHCDAYLIGDYMVVYTTTDNYSTVLLKNHQSKPVYISINEKN